MRRLPLYNLFFNDELGALTLKMSLVGRPAVDSMFLKFSNAPKFSFSVVDEDQRILYGVAMRADFPIYRNDNTLGEYYITFDKETIKKIQAEFLKTRKFNLAHSIDTEDVEVLESFIIDREAGICPQAFADIEDGSWILKVHVLNDQLWENIKHGVFNGFSVESFFDYSKVELSKQIQNSMTLKALKIKLAKLLFKLGAVTAVKDEVEYTFEYEGSELVDGTEVFINDEETDELVHPEDGEYVIDEVKWEIKDGIVRKIEEVEEKPEEEVVKEEVVEETMAEEEIKEEVVEETKEEPDFQAEIDAINKRLDEISNVINDFMDLTTKINSRLEELEAKLSKVVNQVPEKLEKQDVTLVNKVENPYECLRK